MARRHAAQAARKGLIWKLQLRIFVALSACLRFFAASRRTRSSSSSINPPRFPAKSANTTPSAAAFPLSNICRLQATTDEEISRADFDDQISHPIQNYLRAHNLTEKILYIVTTAGVPLKVRGSGGLTGEAASVDSELTLLYFDLHGRAHALPAGIANPFFGKTNAPFRHPDFPIYLVTRLAGYDFDDVKGIIDRALLARNRGKFVIDLKGSDNTQGNTLAAPGRPAAPARSRGAGSLAQRARARKRCDRLRVVGLQRSRPQATPSRFSLAARRHHDRIRVHQRTHLRAPSRQLEHRRAGAIRKPPSLDLRRP